MPYPLEVIYKIAERHGLTGEPELLPNGGMVNEAWQIGDHILRICRKESGKDEAERESLVVPHLFGLGFRLPKLTAFDLHSELTPLPYTLYERAPGVLMGYGSFTPEDTFDACFEIGREIARLGRVDVPPEIRKSLRPREPFTPWRGLAKCLLQGLVSQEEGAEMARWAEFLEPLLCEPGSFCFAHLDIHPWNVFVTQDGSKLEAVIDWGDAGIADPALEFASMPLVTVPSMLQGYTAEGGPTDSGFVPRMLYAGLALALWEPREMSVADFARPWWRLPPGGWEETKAIVERLWPEFALPSEG